LGNRLFHVKAPFINEEDISKPILLPYHFCRLSTQVNAPRADGSASAFAIKREQGQLSCLFKR
jgi:hypothetical protein